VITALLHPSSLQMTALHPSLSSFPPSPNSSRKFPNESMPGRHVSVTRSQKRRRDVVNQAAEDSTPALPPPTKRAKIDKRTSFPYEHLSKLHLTPRALRELNRQTPKPTFPSYELSALETPFPVLEDLGVDKTKHRRSGGPDLSDLRGVWLSSFRRLFPVI
jgi:hypothetical protein